MTETQNPGRRASRRTKTALALLTATAALSGGTQALAPTPALAMNNQGNECQNLPTWERTVCEMEDAGGSGAGGSGNTNGDQGGPTIGNETIEVHGTAPSPRCSFCLPSQIGGGHLGLSDRGGKNPREPRHRGRLTRVGEAPKGKAKPPTKAECEKFKADRLELPTDRELRANEAQLVKTDKRRIELEKELVRLDKEAAELAEQIRSLKISRAPSKVVFAIEDRYYRVTASIPTVHRKIGAAKDEFVQLTREHEALQLKRAAEAGALQKRCRSLYGN
jgi:hypothetical protein